MESNNVQESGEDGKPVQRLQIYSLSATGVSPFWRGLFVSPIPRNCVFQLFFRGLMREVRNLFCVLEKYERDAKKYWDVFYKRHQDKVDRCAEL